MINIMDTRNLKHILKNCTHPYVLMLIGPPLSGKDTVLKELNLDAVMISRDQILLDVSQTDDYNLAFNTVNQKEVYKKLNSLLVDTGRSDKNAIINMTHMSRKRRIYNLKFFPDHYKIAVIFPQLSDEEYKRRNQKRNEEENKFIPDHVIKSMISSYQTVDKQEEGFDKVISL